MRKVNRLFVPLAKLPYRWFKEGLKSWELRRYGRQYTEKHVKVGRLVELRYGYKGESFWGIIRDFRIFNNVEDVFAQIDYVAIIPDANSAEMAIATTRNILSLQSESKDRFIAFLIEIISPIPELIALDNKYFEQVKEGIKTTTIRQGLRLYRTGPGILYSEHQCLLVDIIKVEHTVLNSITNDTALNDGFRSANDLHA